MKKGDEGWGGEGGTVSRGVREGLWEKRSGDGDEEGDWGVDKNGDVITPKQKGCQSCVDLTGLKMPPLFLAQFINGVNGTGMSVWLRDMDRMHERKRYQEGQRACVGQCATECVEGDGGVWVGGVLRGGGGERVTKVENKCIMTYHRHPGTRWRQWRMKWCYAGRVETGKKKTGFVFSQLLFPCHKICHFRCHYLVL